MKMILSRREFLRSSLITGICLHSGLAMANHEPVNAPQIEDRIDVHHHIIPPVYRSSLTKIGITTTNGMPFPEWNVQESIDAMDRNGIRAAITSLSSPGIFFGDLGFTVELARSCNEFSADLVKRYPGRFGGFAVLPLPDTDAAIKEIEYALDVLQLDGVILLTNVGGRYVGSPEFSDVYLELNRRKSIVYVHPTEPHNGMFPKIQMPPSFFEFMFDTTRAVANLIRHNTLDRFSDIRFILAHAGGTAPYLTWKMSLTARLYGNSSQNVIPQMQRLYYDTALSTSQYPLGLLKELAGTDHIIFGSDFPFAPEFVMASCLYELDHYGGFDAKALKKIYRTNAAGLFPRLKF